MRSCLCLSTGRGAHRNRDGSRGIVDVEDSRYLEHLVADEILQGDHGGEVLGGVFKKEEPDFRMGG